VEYAGTVSIGTITHHAPHCSLPWETGPITNIMRKTREEIEPTTFWED
jgi:hypothetical protein